MRTSYGWAIGGLLVLAVCCHGAEGQNGEDEVSIIYLGAGTLISTKPYVGMDARVYPVPLFAYEGKRVYLRGITGGYRLVSEGGWSIGPVVQPRFDGYEEHDSPFLAGMEDRDWSLDGGVGISWLTEVGLFGLSYVTDLLGHHDGQELDLSYTIMFPWAGFDVIPSVGVRWKSENLVDYYFGVRPGEAGVGRTPYEGDGAVDPYLRVAARRKLSERWTLLAAAQYEWLADEITDSPIVEDDYDASFLLGVMYSW